MINLILKNLIFVAILSIGWALISCDKEDESFNKDHPRFADTSTKRISDQRTISGGVVAGASQSSSGSSKTTKKDDQSSSDLGVATYTRRVDDMESQIDINDKLKTLNQSYYSYNLLDSNHSKYSSNNYVKLTRYYSYEKKGTHQGGTIILAHLSKVSFLITDPTDARSANWLQLYGKTNWTAGVEQDITDYYLKENYTEKEEYFTVLVETNLLYINYYYPSSKERNSGPKQGKVYKKK